MTTHIELDDDLYIALKERAQTFGLSPDTLAQRLLRTHLAGAQNVQSVTFRRNMAAFQGKLPELLQTYAGQFVAFLDGELVGIRENIDGLRTEMYGKHGYVNMLITEVTTQPRVRHVTHRHRVR